jgi:DNA-binding response OmpR family regulator
MRVATLFERAELEAGAVQPFALRGMQVERFADPGQLIAAWRVQNFDGIVIEDAEGQVHHWLATLQAHIAAQTAIIVVGSGGVQSISRALLHGADDYATPGDGADGLAQRLLARARVKIDQRRSTWLQLGVYSLDAMTRTLAAPGHHVTLTPRECTLVRILFENPGRVVALEKLSIDVCGQVGEAARRALEQHVYKLRKKCALLSQGKPMPLQIDAVYGMGYRLRA